jgi:hypothetical protein
MTTMRFSAVRASEPLRVYMILSYDTMRNGNWIVTALYPVAVYLSGLIFFHKKLPGSLSAYYWLVTPDEPNVPRTIFVGGLFAFAVFFLLYRGFSRAENRALNAAALFAALVALIPKAHGTWNPGIAHATAAILLFLCLAYVIWTRAKDTFKEFEKSGEAPATGKGSLTWYKTQYRGVSIAMGATPVIAVVLDQVVGKWLGLGDPDLGKLGTIIFFVESGGIWAFARYWYLKRSELWQSGGLAELLKEARKAESASASELA